MFSSLLIIVCVALGAKNLSPLFRPFENIMFHITIADQRSNSYSVAEADDAHVCALVLAPWAINQRTAGGVR